MTVETIQRLRAESGLSDGQISRLMGISVRAVHHWASGTDLTPRHVERLMAISDQVFAIDATSPEDRRACLLDSSNGPSILSQMFGAAPRSQVIQYSIPLIERLGA